MIDNILFLYNHQGYSVAFGRTIRVMKITRVLRFVKMVQFLSELRLMLNCLAKSSFALMWSFILLALIQLMFAIALVQHMSNLVSSKDSGLSQDNVVAIRKAFGSVELATLTLFMSISGGIDWGDAYDLAKLSGWLGSVMFLGYISFMWLAVTNIITSVFID